MPPPPPKSIRCVSSRCRFTAPVRLVFVRFVSQKNPKTRKWHSAEEKKKKDALWQSLISQTLAQSASVLVLSRHTFPRSRGGGGGSGDVKFSCRHLCLPICSRQSRCCSCRSLTDFFFLSFGCAIIRNITKTRRWLLLLLLLAVAHSVEGPARPMLRCRFKCLVQCCSSVAI